MGDDFECLPPGPSESSQVVTLMRVPRGVRAEDGIGLEAATAGGREGGGAPLGYPDCDLGLKDFRNGLGAEKAGGAASSQAQGPRYPWDSPSVEFGAG